METSELDKILKSNKKKMETLNVQNNTKDTEFESEQSKSVKTDLALPIAITFALAMDNQMKLFSYRLIKATDFLHNVDTIVNDFNEQWVKLQLPKLD